MEKKEDVSSYLGDVLQGLTWKLPWFAGVQVHLHQRPLRRALVGHLLVEVVAHQLLVAGVEPEPRRQCGLYLPQAHPFLPTCLPVYGTGRLFCSTNYPLDMYLSDNSKLDS